MDLLSPFGPVIGAGFAPTALVERLNRFCDPRVSPGQSSEFLLPQDSVFADADAIGPFLEIVGRPLGAGGRRGGAEPGADRGGWIVSQVREHGKPRAFSQRRRVAARSISPTPEIAREARGGGKDLYFRPPRRLLNFLIGGKQRFSKSLFSVKPRVGDVLVFPGWLLHGVEPFRGAGERRSLAFNAYVDD